MLHKVLRKTDSLLPMHTLVIPTERSEWRNPHSLFNCASDQLAVAKVGPNPWSLSMSSPYFRFFLGWRRFFG